MARRGRRETIMQAAEKLFTQRRFHEITLDDIVQEAHVGKGTVYKYFRDKDDLFFQVAISGFDELCEAIRRKVPGEAPFEAQLLSACEAVTAFFERRRQLFRMFQSEDARMCLARGRAHEQWMEKGRQLARVLGEVIARGRTEGLVREDLPPACLAEFLLGLLRTRARPGREGAADVTTEQLVDLFLYGARQRARPVAAASERSGRNG